jgi:hypothetical protein
MEILDLVEGKSADNGHLDKTEFMNLRSLQPRGKPANTQAKSASQYWPAIDNLIHGLVDLLPKSDGIWPIEDRAKWLRLRLACSTSATRPTGDEHCCRENGTGQRQRFFCSTGKAGEGFKLIRLKRFANCCQQGANAKHAT